MRMPATPLRPCASWTSCCSNLGLRLDAGPRPEVTVEEDHTRFGGAVRMTSGNANRRGSGGRLERSDAEALRLRDRREKSGQEVLKRIGAHLRVARVERKLTLE